MAQACTAAWPEPCLPVGEVATRRAVADPDHPGQFAQRELLGPEFRDAPLGRVEQGGAQVAVKTSPT
jgi:hypothetical protein